MIVRDIMTEEPAYVEISDTVGVAIDLLNELDVRHLPVLSHGEVVGMLSDRDISSYDANLGADIDGESRDIYQVRVSSVMSSDVFSVSPEDDLSDVIRLFIEQKVLAVPVVDPIEDSLVGIVSYIDILIACEDYF